MNKLRTGLALVTVYRCKRRNKASGYNVQILKGNRMLASYGAGANPKDSQAPGISAYKTVKEWALGTASEMFLEAFGRLPSENEFVFEDDPEC